MTARLRAIGIATTAPVRAQADIARAAIATGNFTDAQAKRLTRIYERSGIDTRAAVLHDTRLANGNPMGFLPPATDADDRGPSTGARMEAYERCAPDLAIASARDALTNADCAPEDVTHLITVSCTGNVSPGVDHALIEQLDLPRSIARTNVGFMGCHGAINALRVANAFADADLRARILVTCVELCSLHYYYGHDAEKTIANALFSDGAASAIVDGDSTDAPRIASTASHTIPESAHEMGWLVRDHGFEMTLTRRVPQLIEEHTGMWVTDWLRAHDLTIDEISNWAIHPGGPKILDAAQRALALTDEQMAPSRDTLRRHGNMSSPTVLAILDTITKRENPTPTVALAFGPGLAIEAALFL